MMRTRTRTAAPGWLNDRTPRPGRATRMIERAMRRVGQVPDELYPGGIHYSLDPTDPFVKSFRRVLDQADLFPEEHAIDAIYPTEIPPLYFIPTPGHGWYVTVGMPGVPDSVVGEEDEGIYPELRERMGWPEFPQIRWDRPLGERQASFSRRAQPAVEFSPGNRVKAFVPGETLTAGYHVIEDGDTGTVTRVFRDIVGVLWDKYRDIWQEREGFHDVHRRHLRRV